MSRRSGAAKSQRPVTEEKEESGSRKVATRNGERAHQRLPPIVPCHGPNHPKPTSRLGQSSQAGRLHPEPRSLNNQLTLTKAGIPQYF